MLERIAALLADGLKDTNGLIAQVEASNLPDQAKYDVVYELRTKQAQFERGITQALGVTIEATVAPKREPPRNNFAANGPVESFAHAVPGQDFAVKIHLNNPASTALKLNRLWLSTPPNEKWTIAPEAPPPPPPPAPAAAPDAAVTPVPAAPAPKTAEKVAPAVVSIPTSVGANQAIDQRFSVRVPENAAVTRPYFVRPNDEQPYYDLIDEQYRNLSTAPYPLAAWMEFTYNGVVVRTGQVVQTARQETGPGMVLNPLMIAPPVSVQITPAAGIAPLGEKSFALSALVRAEAENGAKGSVRLDLPAGWRAEPGVASFTMERAGQQQSVSFRIFPDRLEEKPYSVTAVAESAGHQYREGFVTAGYPGLRPYNLYIPATYRTSGVDVKITSGLRIGYIMGTGDAVPQSLENISAQVEFLGPQDIAKGDLQRFDVILLGVRAYTARPELATNNQRLLDYVKNGGAVVVQYNSVQYDHNFGPYPYSLPATAERVVDEHSPVQFLDPKDPLLTWPNRITEKDFAGWVEERGHSFMKTWDPHYKAPLEMHDPGQDPQAGGLIYAPYGRGVYVYVAFALYRQLPDGVPGAYRLMANLLSLPRNPGLVQSPAGPAQTTAPTR